MKIKTGVFSGSFNPVHIGHLALANYLCEFEALDEIWFMVTPQNPLKKAVGLLPDEKRLELVKTAISGYSRFFASDFEFSLPRPSYTINTLSKLKETYPEREFSLIIGSDNWKNFSLWKDSKKIVAENSIFVYPRPGFPVEKETLPPHVYLSNAPLLDISSTFIRESLLAGKDIRFFLPSSIYKEIYTLYTPQQ